MGKQRDKDELFTVLVSKWAAVLGSRGGKATKDALTPEQRKANARKAGKASGKARMSSVSAEDRKRVASIAAKKRWANARKGKEKNE